MIKCECGKIMENLGNVSGIIYTSYPCQWDEVFVCHKCKFKKTIRCHDGNYRKINLNGYKEMKEEIKTKDFKELKNVGTTFYFNK